MNLNRLRICFNRVSHSCEWIPNSFFIGFLLDSRVLLLFFEYCSLFVSIGLEVFLLYFCIIFILIGFIASLSVRLFLF